MSFANPNSTYLIRAFPLLTFLWVCSKISSFSYISQTAKEQDRTDWRMDRTRYQDGCFCWRSSAAAATSFWFLPARLYSCRDASSDSPREPPWAPPSDSLGPPVPCQNDYKTVLVHKEEIQVTGVDKTPNASLHLMNSAEHLRCVGDPLNRPSEDVQRQLQLLQDVTALTVQTQALQGLQTHTNTLLKELQGEVFRLVLKLANSY